MERSFLQRRKSELSLRDRVTSSVFGEQLKVKLLFLYFERKQLKQSGYLVRMPSRSYQGEVFWECPTGRWHQDRSRIGYISLSWLGNALVCPQMSWKWSGRGKVWDSLEKIKWRHVPLFDLWFSWDITTKSVLSAFWQSILCCASFRDMQNPSLPKNVVPKLCYYHSSDYI